MDIKPLGSYQAPPTCVPALPPCPGANLRVLPGPLGRSPLGVSTSPTQLRMGEGMVTKAGAWSGRCDTAHCPGPQSQPQVPSLWLCRELGWLLELVGLRVPVAMPPLLLSDGGETEPLQPRTAAPLGAPFQPPATDAEAVPPSPSLGARERAGEGDRKAGEFRSLCLPLMGEGCPGE